MRDALRESECHQEGDPHSRHGGGSAGGHDEGGVRPSRALAHHLNHVEAVGGGRRGCSAALVLHQESKRGTFSDLKDGYEYSKQRLLGGVSTRASLTRPGSFRALSHTRGPRKKGARFLQPYMGGASREQGIPCRQTPPPHHPPPSAPTGLVCGRGLGGRRVITSTGLAPIDRSSRHGVSKCGEFKRTMLIFCNGHQDA